MTRISSFGALRLSFFVVLLAAALMLTLACGSADEEPAAPGATGRASAGGYHGAGSRSRRGAGPNCRARARAAGGEAQGH